MPVLPMTSDRNGLIVMASIFTALSIGFVSARLYARRLLSLPLLADDWLSVSSLLFVLALNGIFLGGTAHGAISGHSVVVNDIPVTSDLEHTVQRYKYAFQTVEKPAFGLIKLSILFLYKRIFTPVRAFNILCWVMIGVVITWSVTFFFATIFQCSNHWSLNWAPIEQFLLQCDNSLDVLTVFCATDIFTDLVIIIMPIPMVWRLKMSKERKFAVTSIFLIGIFTIGAGMARMDMYLASSYGQQANPDFISDFTQAMLWSEIELNVAMLCSCMPTLIPVLKKARKVSKATNRYMLSRNFSPPQRRGEKLGSESELTAATDSTRVFTGKTDRSTQQEVMASRASREFDVERQTVDQITVTREFMLSADNA